MQVIGNWEIVKSLGGGGQAATFEVIPHVGIRNSPEHYKHYALKTLHTKNEQAIQRFKQEIEVLESLHHPTIVKLHDASGLNDNENPHAVFELCEGGNLKSAQPYWCNNVEFALQIFEDVCSGIAAAHSHSSQIVHRDIKPENILLKSETGPAVVADFGICYVHDNEIRTTRTDEIVGPRVFIAPELEHGGQHDVKPVSDVYSLGMLLYYLLSGGQVVKRERHRDERYDLVNHHNNGRFERINQLLDMMLIEEPGKRASSAVPILEEFKKVRSLMSFNVIGTKIPQPCAYCGQGKYWLVVEKPTSSSDKSSTHEQFFNFLNVKPFTSTDWRVLCCDYCGHIQWFRVENASQNW